MSSHMERRSPGAGTGTGAETGNTLALGASNITEGDGAGDQNCLLSGRTDDAEEFLECWRPSGPWVLTSIAPDGGKTTTRTFGASERLPMRDWIEERQGRQNIYFSVNDLSRRVSKKAEKDDVAALRALHVDVDPRPGEPLNKERARAEKVLREYKPAPTVIIDSGGGFQAFWLGEEPEPLPDTGTPERDGTVRDAELRNLKVETALQADACHNIDRIMRLPGTINVPGEKKRKKGRVSALARVVDADWSRRYTLGNFPRADEPKRVEGGNTAHVELPRDLPCVDNLDALPAAVSARTKMLIVNGGDPDDPGRHESRSECLWAVLCEMVRAGCNDATMAAVILDPDYGVSAHVLEQPRPRQYAERQIKKARAEAFDKELAELNAAHVVIRSMGPKGKCRVMQRLPSSFGREVIAFQSFEDFRNGYMNRRKAIGEKDGKDIYMPLGKWWLENPNRRQHKTLTFLPGGADVLEGDQLNLWGGFGVQPKAGSWALMRQHIFEVLAGGDEDAANYILRWAAYAVQHPDKPAEAALVFRGDLGTGKGMFGRAMLRMFGRHGVRTQGAAVLDSRFNAHLRDTVLLFADEVDWDSHRSSAQLKGMVTEESLFIEPKGVDATNQPNYLHIIIASNNNWVIPAAPGERRFAVFGVPNHRKKDDEYWDALQAETDGGGLEAMLHDLLAMDLTGWHPRRNIPQTRGLSHQKLAGLSGADAIVREMLMGAVAPGAGAARFDAGLTLNLRPLIRWAVDNRIVTTDPGVERMADAVKRMGVKRRKLTVERKQQWVWPLPPLAEARATWALNLGISVDWPDDGEWTDFGG